MTLECSKCHDHKYDPLSQKNYYQLFSFFNNVNEAGQISWDDALPVPTLQLPTAQQQAIVNTFKPNSVQRFKTKRILLKSMRSLAMDS
jgi:hypothetical protein